MQPNIRLIIWLSLLLGFTSMVYFLSLPAHLPVAVTAIIVAAFGFFSYKWFAKNIPAPVDDMLSKGDRNRAYIFFFTGLAVIVFKAIKIETEYGHWDAWWLWNHHARYLQDPTYWRELFKLNDEYHPDYPLFLSSVIAFFWRLSGSYHMLVPYTFSVFITIIIPASIFLSLYTRHLTIAGIAFTMLMFNDAYLNMALAQYADQPLGFLFLCTFICLEYARRQKQVVVVIGALLGCCIWMKNEGMMLALVFVLFNAKTLLFGGNVKRFAAGIAFPLIVYAFLKLNAPGNDLIKGQGAKTLAFFSDVDRYKMVGNYFYTRLTEHTLAITLSAIIFSIYCYMARKLPGRNILTLITCAIGFGFVYIFTPHELSWHLSTSFDRVLFQLVPAFVYILARNFCNLRFSVDAQQFQ